MNSKLFELLLDSDPQRPHEYSNRKGFQKTFQKEFSTILYCTLHKQNCLNFCRARRTKTAIFSQFSMSLLFAIANSCQRRVYLVRSLTGGRHICASLPSTTPQGHHTVHVLTICSLNFYKFWIFKRYTFFSSNSRSLHCYTFFAKESP